MFLLSTTSILSCFVSCLTVMFALALSDRITGVEGHFSLMNAFSFNSLSKISVKVKDSPKKENQRTRFPLKHWYKFMMYVLYDGTGEITNFTKNISQKSDLQWYHLMLYLKDNDFESSKFHKSFCLFCYSY